MFSPASTLGCPRVHFRRTDSTNERARALAQAGAPHGTLVTAGEQTAGRGRQGRRWSAPPGEALLMSLLVRSPPPLLPLIAAVAVCDAVEEGWWEVGKARAGEKRMGGERGAASWRRGQAGERVRVQIKWPNDVVLVRGDADGRLPGKAGTLAKLAGILIEGRPQEEWAVVGVGVNVAVQVQELPEEVRRRAASLGLARGAIEPLLARVLAALARRLREPREGVLEAWRARDALRGKEVSWAGGGGRAAGVDEAGRLVVELVGGGRVALEAGEVHLGVG